MLFRIKQSILMFYEYSHIHMFSYRFIFETIIFMRNKNTVFVLFECDVTKITALIRKVHK
ncbi:MAG: hypothetical protein A2W17_11275 [Planctomycetes bacterium RBG_16_41_13]|nr:MAG: hypothetical protein A2W17_11275 [Planctomycetes bacterium RBG_16_41_13]